MDSPLPATFAVPTLLTALGKRRKRESPIRTVAQPGALAASAKPSDGCHDEGAVRSRGKAGSRRVQACPPAP